MLLVRARVVNFSEHSRTHKIQIRLFVCYMLGKARRIQFPTHVCRTAENEYLSREEPFDHLSAFLDEENYARIKLHTICIINYAFLD